MLRAIFNLLEPQETGNANKKAEFSNFSLTEVSPKLLKGLSEDSSSGGIEREKSNGTPSTRAQFSYNSPKNPQHFDDLDILPEDCFFNPPNATCSPNKLALNQLKQLTGPELSNPRIPNGDCPSKPGEEDQAPQALLTPTLKFLLTNPLEEAFCMDLATFKLIRKQSCEASQTHSILHQRKYSHNGLEGDSPLEEPKVKADDSKGKKVTFSPNLILISYAKTKNS
jgi:hypothetical protein